MKTRGLLIVAVLLTVLAPTPAFSQDQPWLADRKHTIGPGYRVGNFELHPGFAAEFGYDSNFFQLAPSDSNGSPAASLRLRLTPSFSFSTLGPQRRASGAVQTPPPPLEVFGGVSATYNEFFPVSGTAGQQQDLVEQRNIGGQADLRLNINPGHPWSGTLTGSFARLLQPTQDGLVGQGFKRMVPSAGAELVWNPNNGMLDWRLGYNFTGIIFEVDRFDNALTNFSHTLQMRGRWRFLPRSALIYDARFGLIHYINEGEKTGSMPVRAQVGYNGLITPNFGALLMLGWGSSFYDPSKREQRLNAPVEDFDSIIAHAEIRYFLSPTRTSDPNVASAATSSFALGFNRDFHDAFVGSYFERDRGYLKLTYYLGGKFVVILDAGAGALVNPKINTDAIPDKAGWTDIRVDAAGFAEYRFKDAFGINATLRYGTRISNESLPIPPDPLNPNQAKFDKLEWSQFEAYLGARWLM